MTQTEVTQSSKTDEACQTIVKNTEKLCVETQTVSTEWSAEKPQHVVIDIPESMLEAVPSKPVANAWSPPTEMIIKKVGDVCNFNFIGAFYNFDDMETEEIVKVQNMLNNTFFDICLQASHARRIK